MKPLVPPPFDPVKPKPPKFDARLQVIWFKVWLIDWPVWVITLPKFASNIVCCLLVS